jgi:hypothetical protein
MIFCYLLAIPTPINPVVFSRMTEGDEAAFREIFHEYNTRLFSLTMHPKTERL